jgi:hypothetical protein
VRRGVISQTGGLITGTNVNINGSGFASSALAAQGGQIIWNGGTITMTNNTASGVITAWEQSGSVGTVTVNGTTFPNPVSQGVELGGGGAVTLNGVNITTTSFGVFAHEAFSSLLTPNMFTMNGGSLTAVRPFSTGLATESPSFATFNVNNAVVTATQSMSTGLVRLMDVTSGSTATLNASGSTLSGSICTSTAAQSCGTTTPLASTNTVNLINGTVWNIQGPENSNVTNLTNNASTINFPFPTGNPTLQSSYLTLTTVNYIGTGGTIGLNTFLGTDGSPSDRLIINGGTATGSSLLRITNTGGVARGRPLGSARPFGEVLAYGSEPMPGNGAGKAVAQRQWAENGGQIGGGLRGIVFYQVVLLRRRFLRHPLRPPLGIYGLSPATMSVP